MVDVSREEQEAWKYIVLDDKNRLMERTVHSDQQIQIYSFWIFTVPQE